MSARGGQPAAHCLGHHGEDQDDDGEVSRLEEHLSLLTFDEAFGLYFALWEKNEAGQA